MPFSNFNHVAASSSSSKNPRIMSLQSILYNNSPQAHIELEVDVFDVAQKHVKILVHPCKK
jgi:hypothetical protein